MLIEQANVKLVVAGNNDVTPVDCQSPADLVRLVAVGAAQATFTLSVWSRDIRATSANIDYIKQTSDGKVGIYTATPMNVREGDLVTIAATTGSVYVGDKRVLRIDLDKKLVVLDVAYTAGSTAGTIVLKLTGAELELYRVVANISGTSNFGRYENAAGVPYVCQDPVSLDKPAAKARIYLQFSLADTYRITLAQRLAETFSS